MEQDGRGQEHPTRYQALYMCTRSAYYSIQYEYSAIELFYMYNQVIKGKSQVIKFIKTFSVVLANESLRKARLFMEGQLKDERRFDRTGLTSELDDRESCVIEKQNNEPTPGIESGHLVLGTGFW